MWLFPPQTKFPLCTLAETPRSAAHCIEYAHLIVWGSERGGEAFDADDPEHMKWVFETAAARAAQFGIPGVTLSHTQGVVKNIIPAIPSTNAIVAAVCALEVVKMATMCSMGMANCMIFNGVKGVYTHTVAYDRDPTCPVCSSGVPLVLPPGATLQTLLDGLVAAFPDRLSAPSVSYGTTQLYARGVFEADTRPNLPRLLVELLPEANLQNGVTLFVNDKKLTAGALRVRLSLTA